MTIERAREEFPQWAMITVTGPQRRVIDDAEWTDAEPKKLEWKLPISDRARAFWKKHLILIVACLFLPLWTAGACWITASIVRHNTEVETEERVRHEMNGNMQSYLDQQEQQRMATGLLTGADSLQAAMDSEADALAKLLYGYRNNSLRDRKTLIWCAIARADSNAYPGTIEAVVNQSQQWMFYSENNPVREDDRQLALEQLKLWHDGKYPAGFSNEFVYAEWSQNDIALRNTWEKNSKTAYWRMPE